jgi:branched-chain amino acid transport system permease protein
LEFTLITLLNGISYGLLLFMLSSGLTLIFSMMGVLNFAHASFYMLGAYVAYSISLALGFWPALLIAPLAVAAIGTLVECYGLRSLRKAGTVAELLFTFGLSYVIVELVQLIWGRNAVHYPLPKELEGALFTIYTTTFPVYRGFMILIALLMAASIYLVFTRTRIGLIIQAALTHPDAAEALGHNVPRIFTLVFAAGCGLAGLAGVIGGNAFVTEPGMAATVGSIIFVVVVVGGMGSLAGALLASLLIGILQTFAVALDYSLISLLHNFGVDLDASRHGLLSLTIAQMAPVLPYLLLVLMLVLRPRGLMGTREGCH